MDKSTRTTDDWTQNWQRRIAVRITSIVLWSLGFLSMGVLAIVVSGVQEEAERAYASTLEHIAAHVIMDLNQTNAWNAERILAVLEARMGNLSAFQIQSNRGTISVGETRVTDVQVIRAFPFVWRDGTQEKITLTGFHPPLEQMVRKQQVHLVMLVGGGIILFGIALAWVINKNVRQPFETLISATKAFSSGQTDIRVELRRVDEFGVLGEFFNEMFDRVSEKEAILKTEVQEKHAALKALQEHRDHLEEIVLERTEALEVAHDEAMAANQAKSAFLANMSHEIRTPLTAIIGFSETLRDDRIEKKVRDSAADTVIRSGKHLLNIINDILDLSKIEANKLVIEALEVDVFQLLSDLGAVIELQAQQKHLRFEIVPHFPLPTVVKTDPTRVKQILLNLCSNALKFTSNGGIKLEIVYLAEQNQLRLAVIDSGIGLRSDQIQRLFKPFGQADNSTSRRYGGTGLGLHISKQLAEMMGGTIRVDSAYGIGSRFEVTIAAGDLSDVTFIQDAEHIPQKQSSTQQDGPLQLQGHILLAEDNEDNQNLIALLIRKTGLHVEVVANGREALMEAAKNAFDLILMDIQMPMMDGLEATKNLRQEGYLGPIVALTANVMKEEIERYIAAGFTNHLSKPIEPEAFYAVLEEYCTIADVQQDEAQDDAETELVDPMSSFVPVEPTESDGATDLINRPTMDNTLGTIENPLLEDPDFSPLVKRFLARLPKTLNELDVAVQRHDWSAVGEFAHMVKGCAGNFGYPELTALAGQLEDLIRLENTDAVQASYQTLSEHAHVILQQHG